MSNLFLNDLDEQSFLYYHICYIKGKYMKKYSKKKHLSLHISENENWTNYNRKETRTYANLYADWKERLNNISKEEKQHLFFKYALEGNKKMLKYIIRTVGSVDINAFDSDNNNALMFALKSGNVASVKYLMSLGIDANYINVKGFSPLHFAVRKNNLNLVALLVDGGADINIKDAKGQTVIFDAVYENNTQMISALLLNGVDINSQDYHDVTPLHIAVEDKSRFEALYTLINNGANINAVDKNGKNALMKAIEHNNNSVMDCLIKCGTDLNHTDAKGGTAIMYCAKMGNREALRVLISKGANVLAVDKFGKKAVDIAKKQNHSGCVEILTKAEKIYKAPHLTNEQKVEMLKDFGTHNKSPNSCARSY